MNGKKNKFVSIKGAIKLNKHAARNYQKIREIDARNIHCVCVCAVYDYTHLCLIMNFNKKKYYEIECEDFFFL